MRLSRYALILLCLVLTAPYSASAFAQNAAMVDSSSICTMPRENYPMNDSDDRWRYCDIYMRQFTYREIHNDLKQKMETRAENYKASTKSVRDNYKAELERYYASLGN